MDRLTERAAEGGIEASYVDGRGYRRQVDPRVLRRLLEIVSRGETSPARGRLPATVVFRRGRDAALRLSDVPPTAPIHWAVAAQEAELASGDALSGAWRLPENLPLGMFRLDVAVKTRAGPAIEHARLLVAPARAYGGEHFAGGRRVWALGGQLYGVRSQHNWGHGDFTDLLGLLELAADLGAAGIGINPLHALFADAPERASPYSPNSRLFLNPLYIDLDAVPEFPGLAAAGLTREVARLRDAAMVDHAGVAAAKLAGLRLAFARFRAQGSAERPADLEVFRREHGRTLGLFASFEVLRASHGRRWRDWASHRRS